MVTHIAAEVCLGITTLISGHLQVRTQTCDHERQSGVTCEGRVPSAHEVGTGTSIVLAALEARLKLGPHPKLPSL